MRNTITLQSYEMKENLYYYRNKVGLWFKSGEHYP